jgi:hypothetical protein
VPTLKATAGTVGVVGAVVLSAVLVFTGRIDLPELLGPETAPPAATPTVAPVVEEFPTTGPNSFGTPEAYAAALDRLATIEVKGRAPRTGYDRSEFGPAWSDAAGDFAWSRNGIDTRNDLLSMALDDVECRATSQVSRTGTCAVQTGVQVIEPYSGDRDRPFDRERCCTGRYARDGEHLVSLSWAWQHGAADWSQEKREAFNNHIFDGGTGHVILVDPGLNRAKSSHGPAAWLPPNRVYRCQFATIWTNTIADYELWINPPDRDALHRILTRCVD